MIFDAPNRNHLWANLIVEECIRCGVGLFCIAPGSRSTPLTTAVATHPEARHLVHFDERGSAFAALGFARATGKPAAWITTSGTALANGMPAVIEASVDHVPLLLLTADRPPELRFTGANQTIDQVKLFGDAVRWFFDLPAPDGAIDPAMVLTTIDQAVNRTVRAPSGPVHINCMFREPLAPVRVGETLEKDVEGLRPWHESRQPYTHYVETQAVPVNIDSLASDLAQVQRGLLVAGKLSTIDQAEAVTQLAGALGWPLLADIGSQGRLGKGETLNRITYFDHALVSDAIAEAEPPEAVLHIGGRATSKRLLQYLERTRPASYIVVHDHPERFDPRHQVTQSIEAAIPAFVKTLAAELKVIPTHADPEWLKAWQTASNQVETHVEAVLGEMPDLNEPLVARLISAHLPEQSGLFLGSSMPIRDMDMYAVGMGHRVQVAANRGASGIDGTIASAVGFAQGLRQPVTLVLGDLAFLHDLNSLALLRNASYPVVIVVINNDGGGIFSFLPIAKHEAVFEPYFGTPHGLTFAQAAALFEVPYIQPETPVAFSDAYKAACMRETSTIIEVRTDRHANKQLHDRLLNG